MRALAGLSRERTDGAAWTVTSDPDACVGGARAVALLLAVIWGTSLPLLPWKLPLVPALLDRTYGIIAANRHRLPGDTPWCVEHPESCEPQADD